MAKGAKKTIKKKVEKKEAKPKGRPSIYNVELAEKICEKIATTSWSMKSICAELKIPVITVLCWLCETHPNYIPEFAKMYARAKDMQTEVLADEILEIADDGSNDLMTIVKGNEAYELENKEVTNRSKLRVDARKWIASKLKPKKYGDKTDITSDGKSITPTMALNPEQLTQVLKEIRKNAVGSS